MQVFISYKSEYREFARRIKETIESWGHGTWFDQVDIPKGGYFRHEIQKGLESSDVLIGIVTPEALASREVQAEWDYAYSGRCRFLLLLHRSVDLPYHLTGVQYIDATANPDHALKQLSDALVNEVEVNDTPTVVKKEVQPLTSRQTDNRAVMLEKVQAYWVEGVLHNALGEQRSLSIGLNNAVEAVLKHRDYGDYEFPDNSLNIHQLFDDMQRELLILGAPGSGKTILLLQLAEKLIAEAQTDTTKPIPAVFNLSTWASKRKPLQDWLIDELNVKYQIPKRLGKQWVESEKLLLLLDGLDEVVEAHRDECLSAINTFRSEYRAVDMAICSRITEYQSLTQKLDLQGAITLQPLSDEQVNVYLADEHLATLRAEVIQDESLQEMASVPFLLNTMAYAYQDATPTTLVLAEDEKRTDHLFETYVEKRIQEDTSDTPYTPRQTRHYLRWLAKHMVDKGETTFAIESLDIKAIDKRWQRILTAIFYGLTITTIVGILRSPIQALLYMGDGLDFSDSIYFTLVQSINSILIWTFVLVSDVLLENRGQLRRTIRFVLIYFVIRLIIYLPQQRYWDLITYLIPIFDSIMGTLLTGLPLSYSFQNLGQQRRWSLRWAILYGVVGGILVWLIYATILPYRYEASFTDNPILYFASGEKINVFELAPIWAVFWATAIMPILAIAGGYRESSTVLLNKPNGGFTQHAKMLGILFLFIVIWSAIIAVFLPLSLQQFVGFDLSFNPASYIMIALIIFGGAALVQHIYIRLALSLKGHIPRWRYDKFLDYATTDLHLLRKVGGSYIFRHRYLLEYFAEKELK